ncbi:MAG: asparagine synthase (glutamine-hydrolyzing) [Rhodospirillales bacterium]|nr:asparagine synthase (glutamine-hydrolyzing) [Rhodospirillales bacterium]
MCGIAGFLSDGARGTAGGAGDADARFHRAVAAMTDAIAHRGPDDSGAWVDAAAGIALGHRRLSILDLSAAGHQPMLSADGRFVLSFNGEIYNFAELSHELEARGCVFRGHSDTEVLLAGFVAWGVDETLRRANGMLALALWDRAERSLTLARDRLGKKPLYYGWFAGTLIFASELKALFAHASFDGEIDRDALGAFVRYSFIPVPASIFRGVRKLPPATWLRVYAGDAGAANSRAATPQPYWSARTAAEQGRRRPFTGDLGEAANALETLLEDAVATRMIADVSLGALLSGGIDSTTIVALMQQASARPVKTFCIGFAEPKYNEASYAAAIARHLGSEHTELIVTADDSRDLIPRLPELYDEPFADSSQLPTFIVSRLARGAVTVALTGDGGDELFAGYALYPRCLGQWRLAQRLPATARRQLARLMRGAAHAPWLADPPAGDGEPRSGRRQRFAAKLAKRAALMRGDGPVGILAEKRAHWDRAADLVPGAQPLAWVMNDPERWVDADDPLQAMMQADIEGYMTDDILVKVDRASMAVALEVRCPLLDHRIVEFALSLPDAMRIDEKGRGKRVLRALLGRHVPPGLTERPKKGFGVPIAAWLRGPLRPWAEELLGEQRLIEGGLFDAAMVRRIWRQHLAGAHDHEQVLWNLLMVEAWTDRWRAHIRRPAGA